MYESVVRLIYIPNNNITCTFTLLELILKNIERKQSAHHIIHLANTLF